MVQANRSSNQNQPPALANRPPQHNQPQVNIQHPPPAHVNLNNPPVLVNIANTANAINTANAANTANAMNTAAVNNVTPAAAAALAAANGSNNNSNNQTFKALPFQSVQSSRKFFKEKYQGGIRLQGVLPQSIQERMKQDCLQVLKFLEQLKHNFFEDQLFYVVSSRWFDIWRASNKVDELNEQGEFPTGLRVGLYFIPPPNGDLLIERSRFLNHSQSNAHLNMIMNPSLKLDKDYFLVNQKIWRLIRKAGGNQIKRYLTHTKEGKMVDISLMNFEVVFIFEDFLRALQQGYKKILRAWVQVGKDFTVNELYAFLTHKVVEEFAKMNFTLPGRPEFLRVWRLDQAKGLGHWMDDLQTCVLTRLDVLRGYLPGQLIKRSGQTVYQQQIGPQSKIIVELMGNSQNWFFFNENNPLMSFCGNKRCDRLGILTVLCSCKKALYCSQPCRTIGRQQHLKLCNSDTFEELDQGKLVESQASKRGLVGLRNLGNTCFMNSGLQCLLHLPQFAQYFLSDQFQPEINPTNPLGSGEGKLVKAFAQLVKKSYFGKEQVIAPTRFKKIMGKFQTMFAGYQQQDSGQFINYLLDGLHEDLNRLTKKQYIEEDLDMTLPDQELADISWSIFRKRNDSKIIDLFYGLFKTRIQCDSCPNFSIKFQPFNILQLPIPARQTKTFQFYYLVDNLLHPVSINYEPIQAPPLNVCYQKACKQIGTKEGAFIAYAVSSSWYDFISPDVKQIQSLRKNYKDRRSIILRTLSDMQQRGLEDRPTKVAVSHLQADKYFKRRLCFLRGKVVSLSWTVRQFMLFLIIDFCSIYGQKQLKQFIENSQVSFMVSRPFGQSCLICKSKCKGCMLSPSQSPLHQYLKKQTQIEVVWAKEIIEGKAHLFQHKKGSISSGHQSFKKSDYEQQIWQPTSIQECLKQLQETEVLQEQNKWYCGKCKQFRCARMTTQIFRLPQLLIVGLKRFKSLGKQYLKKVTALVRFPLKDFRVGQFALSPRDREQRYDLFGISNHMGSLGGGHYTAFCLDKQRGWCQFDDGRVKEMGEGPQCDKQNYLLFYRRRD